MADGSNVGSNAVSFIIDDKEEGLFRVHRSAFVDQAIFERERDQIFSKSWLFAGHVSEFPKPGDFVTRKVGGRPLILSHGDDGEIRALLNTCRHRGNLVCRENKGNAEVFRCFYHGWVFSTRGELKGVPGEEAYSDAFDRDALGLEPVPRMHNHRGLIFVSYDPEMEDFYSYMADAIKVIDNTLDQGDMEFLEGQFRYSMRANWKLLVENSMDGYHVAYTHERFVSKFLPDVGLEGALGKLQAQEGAPANTPPLGSAALGNGHTTTSLPSPYRRARAATPFLEKFAGPDLEAYRKMLLERHGPEKAHMIEGGSGNYLIFPNLIVIDGWFVFRTFYPVSPDYMEIDAWAAMPKEDSPKLREARLDWYLGFQGPGGFATPDDVEGLEGCQMGFATSEEVEWSDISRGMKSFAPSSSELQMRVFWREWNARMTTGRHCADTDD